MDGLKAAKKRKLTDKALPNVILQNPEFAADSQMYQSLLDMERKLDWTMTRKRFEIQDALTRVPTTERTLRIFLSHTVSNQIWQTGPDSGELANLETGEGIAAWQLKIEGRMLEAQNINRAKDKAPPRKFSTFIKKLVVELQRDPALYPDGNIVEWPRSAVNNPIQDGFTVRRTGDAPTKVRVLMYMEHFPEQFKVASELASVIGVKEESRVGVIQALWNYIKIQGLQDKTDRRMVHADEKLMQVFPSEHVLFMKLPEIVNRFLLPPEPIVLNYYIDPTVVPPERPVAWDVQVKMEDTTLKGRMTALIQTNKETAQQLNKLDEEIALRAQSVHNSHLKRVFLESFAEDPAQFINTWLESQTRDLETILGSGPSEGLTVRQEELKRSEFFKLPWVEEAVAVQEGYRLASKGMQA